MAKKPMPMPNPARRLRGFEPAAGLLKEPIRTIGESRGFSVTKLLTGWAEIVGAELAACTKPVKVGYGRDGLGATLTILTTAAQAPMVQMELPRIKDRVNACYGYAAIGRISVTQTAANGFAEGQVTFDHGPRNKPQRSLDPVVKAMATETARAVQDTTLRAALETLAQNVLSRNKSK